MSDRVQASCMFSDLHYGENCNGDEGLHLGGICFGTLSDSWVMLLAGTDSCKRCVDLVGSGITARGKVRLVLYCFPLAPL